MIDDSVTLTITVDVSPADEALRTAYAATRKTIAHMAYVTAAVSAAPDDEGVTDARDWAYTARDLA